MNGSSGGKGYIRLPTSEESDPKDKIAAHFEKLQNTEESHVRLVEPRDPNLTHLVSPNISGSAKRSSSENDSESECETLKKVGSGEFESDQFSCAERLQIIATLPHLVALVALILLIGYAAAGIRAEDARQLKTEDLEKRFAFVYLVTPNVTEIKSLGLSLQSLGKYFKSKLNYQIVIVHEDIPPLVQGRLQSLSEAPLRFREFRLDGPREFNLSKDNTDSANRTEWGHRNAVRFWFHTAVLAIATKSGILADLDYIARLDSESVFTANIGRDIIREFVLSGAQYGYQSIGKDCGENRTYRLQELAESYVELNGISPRSMNLWASFIRTKSGICLPKFENHFEMINMRFFRSHSGIQDWIRVVDANGGIYRHGWEDATLRYITVALYAAPEKLVRYGVDLIPYKFQKRIVNGRNK